jgi:mRNA interferase MazF
MRKMKTGELWWVDLGEGIGREQNSFRPALIISNSTYEEIVDSMIVLLPCTTRSRGWPNHVPIRGSSTLGRETFAMTEQPRSVSRQRLIRMIGQADETTMTEVGIWLNRWLR